MLTMLVSSHGAQWRNVSALRIAAIYCVLLSCATLGIEWLMAPMPLMGHLSEIKLHIGQTDWSQILPTMSAVLGALAGVLGVAAGPEAAPNPILGTDPTPPDVNGPERVDVLHDIVAELRSLLTDERRELGALRELSNNGTKETVLLAERLASTVLDAELRLTAGVVQAERALRYPTSAATRAAEAALRVERSLTRSETVLRQLPDAVNAANAAVTVLQHETVELTKVGQQIAKTLQDGTEHTLSFVTPDARHFTPSCFPDDIAALRAAGKEITSAALDAMASLSQAAQATVGRLTSAVVAAEQVPQSSSVEKELGQKPAIEWGGIATSLQDAAASLVAGSVTLQETCREICETAADSMQEAVNALQREALALSMQGQQIALQASVHNETEAAEVASSAIVEALERAERSSSVLEAVTRNVTAASEDVALQIGRLAGIASHAETQAAVLPGIAAQLAEVAGRIEAVTLPLETVSTSLPQATLRLEAALPTLDELDRVCSRFKSELTGLPSPQLPDNFSEEIFARMTALSMNMSEAVAKILSSIGAHDAIDESVLSALVGLQETVAALALQGKTAQQQSPTVVQQLATVVRETEALLQQAESLAEAALARRAPAHLLWPAERTATLLAGVEATIGRLRSVATALALTSDSAQVQT